MALNFPSPSPDGFLYTDPSNGVTYQYDSATNSWTARGGGGGGIGIDDIDPNGGLVIDPVDGKLSVKVYDDYGIELDPANGIRQGDSWSDIPSLPSS